MGILTDCRLGFCAEKVRRKTGLSVVGEIRDADRRIGRLEAVTVYDNRVPRGVTINGNQQVDFDANGRLGIISSDGSVGIARSPWGRKHQIDLTVDACTAGYDTIITQDGTVATDSCGEHLDGAGYHTAQVLRAYVSGVDSGDTDYLRWRIWADVYSAIITPNKYMWVEKSGGAGWVKVPCLDDGSTPSDPGNNPGGGG